MIAPVWEWIGIKPSIDPAQQIHYHDPMNTDNPSFQGLTPPLILSSIENLYGLRIEGVLRPLNSYVNRVFEVSTEEGESLVAKFYRPGRWTVEALEEEHEFLFDCSEAEIPVVEPLIGLEGYSLERALDQEDDQVDSGYYFALFPKKAGRNFDAETDQDWLRMGRLIGRLHRVAAGSTCQHRSVLEPALGYQYLEQLEKSGVLHPELADPFLDVARTGLEWIDENWVDLPMHRIHGDCHRGNILDRSLEGLLLFDFDDMMLGPAVQDLWLLLPGRRQDCSREIALLSEGYSDFHPLHPRSWDLVESLRFLRMLHFLSWTALQRRDHGFDQTFPHWGSRAFWIKELEDFQEQVMALTSPGN